MVVRSRAWQRAMWVDSMLKRPSQIKREGPSMLFQANARVLNGVLASACGVLIDFKVRKVKLQSLSKAAGNRADQS